MKTTIPSFIKTEDQQLLKLQQIVQSAIEEEKLIVDRILNEPKEKITRAQSISDKVAQFGGSWNFIIAFAIVLSVWIIFNIASPKSIRFDPYPFILMNLVLSAIAALQAPIIMMSQNRKEEKDRKRSENDYMINLKAELELRILHQKVDLLIEEQIKNLFASQAEQLELLKKIQNQISS
ncbi:MAG: DUF1003 domain-containing protein [Flavobacteriales bacterium]